MKGLILLLATVALSNSQQVDDGQYHPDPNNDGKYIPDNSGQYIPDYTGIYHPDGTGGYADQGTGRYSGDKTSQYSGQAIQYKPSSNIGLIKIANAGGGASANLLSGIQTHQAINALATLTSNFGKTGTGTGNKNFFANNPDATSNLRQYSPDTQRSADGRWKIIRQLSNIDTDGYHWEYETENGINAEESGQLANKGTDAEAMRAKGFFEYTGPDNVKYLVQYTADENGFVPIGNHLPTPPPIPVAILKSLEYQRSSGKQ